MLAGNLIPDELVIDLVCDRLNTPQAKERGVLLDGFPRTLHQAVQLTKRAFKLDILIFLNVSPQSLLDRCLSRRVDPLTGRIYNLKSDPPPVQIMDRLQIRSDDTKEKHDHRMRVYQKQKSALMTHFKEITVEIDADQPIPAVYKRVRHAINTEIRTQYMNKPTVIPSSL